MRNWYPRCSLGWNHWTITSSLPSIMVCRRPCSTCSSRGLCRWEMASWSSYLPERGSGGTTGRFFPDTSDGLSWLSVLATLIAQGLKYGIARPRPLSEFAALIQTGELHINVIGDALRARSFPSGHAQAAASVGVYLLCLYPHRWFWWSVGIALAGFARVYAGVHFPFDVLVGTCIGAGIAVGVFALQRRRHQPTSLQRESVRR